MVVLDGLFAISRGPGTDYS